VRTEIVEYSEQGRGDIDDECNHRVQKEWLIVTKDKCLASHGNNPGQVTLKTRRVRVAPDSEWIIDAHAKLNLL
jgi:hypothetical protein